MGLRALGVCAVMPAQRSPRAPRGGDLTFAGIHGCLAARRLQGGGEGQGANGRDKPMTAGSGSTGSERAWAECN